MSTTSAPSTRSATSPAAYGEAGEAEELRTLVLDILEDCGAAGRPDAAQVAWAALSASDLVLVGLPDDLGGSGGTLADAATVLSATAAAGCSLPVVETAWLAGWLAGLAGRPVPHGPVTLAVGEQLLLEQDTGGHRLTGTVRDLPWRHVATAAYLVLPAAGRVAVVPLGPPREDAALGLPTGDLVVDVVLSDDDLFDLPGDLDAVISELDLRRALARTVQIQGACASVLATAIRYATEREQFGRSLSRYQVIQHYLARVASRTHGVSVASATAVEEFARGGPAAATTVLAAKCLASDAVEEVTALAHQVLGAIGTTKEHPLHRCTVSMWDWRDDAGDEFSRATRLGEAALAGDGDVWEFLAPVGSTA